MAEQCDVQDADEFLDWVQIGEHLAYAALIAGAVDRVENPMGCIAAIAQGAAGVMSMICDDEKAGKAMLRALAMPVGAQARGVKLHRLATVATNKLNAGETVLGELEKVPFDASRQLHVACRVIERMLPQGDAFALFHGPLDGEFLEEGRMKVLSSCDAPGWALPIVSLAHQEIAKRAAVLAADEGNPQ